MLSQAALEIYIQSGMFERRKRKIRDSYSRRLMHLNKSLLANSDTAYRTPTEVISGVYTHIIVPAHLHIPTLLDRLRKKRVILQDLEPYYLPSFDSEHLLSLSVTQVSEERIEAGVRLIADEIKRMLG